MSPLLSRENRRTTSTIPQASREENRRLRGPSLPTLLGSFGRHPSPQCKTTRNEFWNERGGLPPEARRAKGGGAGGVRTLHRALHPYNVLENRRLQPLGHVSGCRRYARRCPAPQAADLHYPARVIIKLSCLQFPGR